MAAGGDSVEIFRILSSKIAQLLYGRTQSDRSSLNKTLDELNSINYKYPVVTNTTKAVLLVNQCCSLVDPQDFDLFIKCCRLITNLVVQQKVAVEGRTLYLSVQWCLNGVKEGRDNVEILIALDALLRGTENELIVEVVKNLVLVQLSRSDKAPESTVYALQVLEASTFQSDSKKFELPEKFSEELKICFEIFLGHLLKTLHISDKLIEVKIFTVCLRGLQNILHRTPELLRDNLGLVLGIIKSYMLYGLKTVDFITPRKLLPSSMSIPEPVTTLVREKQGGKMTRQRKQRTKQTPNKSKKSDWTEDSHMSYSPSTSCVNSQSDICPRVKTSDSEFSDTDGGNLARLSVLTGRVRQAALNLFLQVVKSTEKSVMFSYWSSFIPESLSAGKHNLLTSVLKETSTRGRMVALNVLLALLTTSKMFLAQSEKGDNLSFTPYSVVIGLTLRELHKCLSLALNERSVPVLAQVLKSYSALIQATPYHKLAPGLVTKLVRSVRNLIYHKDTTVQVTALAALGCALSSQPVLHETKDAFLSQHLRKLAETAEKRRNRTPEIFEFDYADFSSSESEDEPPALPVPGKIPWLLQRCLSNLDGPTMATSVKTESLLIVSAMSRNYFEALLGPHLVYVVRSLNVALRDKYSSVRLHAGQCVDFIGQAVNRHLTSTTDGPINEITVGLCVSFWMNLLDCNLPLLLTDEEESTVRAVGCDCFGSMGDVIFENLPREKQLFSVTLLFACSRDEDCFVKGAAVRALALFALYPTLREDSGFVVDTAETIYRVLQEANSKVRVKLSWALGNLSDALVLNKVEQNLGDELPDSLFLKLLKETNKASGDVDKIRMNTMRALGNFLQIITRPVIGQPEFKAVVAEAIDIVVKNSSTGTNMKVRWNACYALSNLMKNPDLYTTDIKWQPQVFNCLTDLVVNFKNFKVRIHAAVALAAPARREFYGQYYQPTFSALARALESAQNLEDFNEYKHRDHLIEQICLSLGHLITLLSDEDLSASNLNEIFQLEVIKTQTRRVWERLLPEKSTVLFEAYDYVTQRLGAGKTLNSEQKLAVANLTEALKQDF